MRFEQLSVPRAGIDWRLPAIGAAAGVAAVQLGPLVVPIAIAGAAFLFLLSRPHVWLPALLVTLLLVPPLPVSLRGADLPAHPAMALFAAALLIGWIRVGEWRGGSGFLLLACTIFSATLFASLPMAFLYSGFAVGAQSTVRWLLLNLSLFVLAWTACGPGAEKDASAPVLRLLIALAALSAGFAVVDFFYQFSPPARFAEQYIHLPDGPRRRAQGVFYDSSALGNFCAMALTLIFAVAGQAREQLRIPRWLLWTPVPVLAVALLLSFSRASALNLIVALLVLAWVRRRGLRNMRAAFTAAAVAAVVTTAITVVAPDVASHFGRRLEFTALHFFEDPNAVLSMRILSWETLRDVIVSQPERLLLGIGYKSLPYTDFLGRPLVADNMYLALLVETGIPGLVALLLLCAALLTRGARLAAHADPAVAALGAFLLAFWCGEMVQMLSGDTLTYWRVTPVYFAILGVAIRRANGPSLHSAD